MAIKFKCDSCGRTLKVPDSAQGKKARCPCGFICVVPALQRTSMADGHEATASARGSELRPSREPAVERTNRHEPPLASEHGGSAPRSDASRIDDQPCHDPPSHPEGPPMRGGSALPRSEAEAEDLAHGAMRDIGDHWRSDDDDPSVWARAYLKLESAKTFFSREDSGDGDEAIGVLAALCLCELRCVVRACLLLAKSQKRGPKVTTASPRAVDSCEARIRYCAGQFGVAAQLYGRFYASMEKSLLSPGPTGPRHALGALALTCVDWSSGTLSCGPLLRLCRAGQRRANLMHWLFGDSLDLTSVVAQTCGPASRLGSAGADREEASSIVATAEHLCSSGEEALSQGGCLRALSFLGQADIVLSGTRQPELADLGELESLRQRIVADQQQSIEALAASDGVPWEELRQAGNPVGGLPGPSLCRCAFELIADDVRQRNTDRAAERWNGLRGLLPFIMEDGQEALRFLSETKGPKHTKRIRRALWQAATRAERVRGIVGSVVDILKDILFLCYGLWVPALNGVMFGGAAYLIHNIVLFAREHKWCHETFLFFWIGMPTTAVYVAIICYCQFFEATLPRALKNKETAELLGRRVSPLDWAVVLAARLVDALPGVDLDLDLCHLFDGESDDEDANRAPD